MFCSGEKYGPSRWVPRISGIPSCSRAAWSMTARFSKSSSSVEESVVGSSAVVPWARWVRQAAVTAAREPSRKSWPPAPWVWSSMKPGDR
jgi:hypothetical protein